MRWDGLRCFHVRGRNIRVYNGGNRDQNPGRRTATIPQGARVYHREMDLKGAVVLITGGSSGIGRAAAEVLAKAGARVAITGRDPERLAEAARSLGVVGIQADVANEADVLRTFHEVKEKLGDLDVLINNAGIGVLKDLTDMDRASFDAVFATNVTGVMLMSREAAKLFKERKQGNLINIASTASLRGAPKGTAYYGSKFALRGMTECWRAELRKYNVRVFLINPSEVITDFARRAGFPQVDNPTKLQGEDIAHMIQAVLEMDGRGFTPELTVFATNPVD
jgi:3-oxoacyl-[acyl-carrier protein] reductase